MLTKDRNDPSGWKTSVDSILEHLVDDSKSWLVFNKCLGVKVLLWLLLLFQLLLLQLIKCKCKCIQSFVERRLQDDQRPFTRVPGNTSYMQNMHALLFGVIHVWRPQENHDFWLPMSTCVWLPLVDVHIPSA